jgi:hypothetical protein
LHHLFWREIEKSLHLGPSPILAQHWGKVGLYPILAQFMTILAGDQKKLAFGAKPYPCPTLGKSRFLPYPRPIMTILAGDQEKIAVGADYRLTL